ETNILASKELIQEEASQKSAKWRALTAGSLLREVEVQRDLKIILVDKTEAVIAQHRRNQQGYRVFDLRADALNPFLKNLREDRDKVVNIDSDRVRITNAYSEQKIFDLECT